MLSGIQILEVVKPSLVLSKSIDSTDPPRATLMTNLSSWFRDFLDLLSVVEACFELCDKLVPGAPLYLQW